MADSPIGEIPILISADFSDVESGITAAVSAASAGADSIASAFDIPDLTTGLTSQLDLFSDASREAGAAASSAADQLALFDTNAIQAADSMQQAGDGLAAIAGGATNAASGLDSAGSSAEEAGTEAEGAEGGFAALAESMIAVGEALAITEGLKEFGEEALTAYGTVQSVTIGLTQLTGSAQQAEEVIEQVKERAATEPFAFPEIAPTIQKMVALGVTAEQIPGVMQAVADAAAATGNQFNQVANSFDRMTLSGTVNARALVQLGISTQGLADVMGVAADQVKTAFAALDQSQRIETLEAAMDKFAGAAEAQAQGIAGQWQIFQNQFEEVMVSVGEAIAPAVEDMLNFGKAVLNGIAEAVEAFNELPEPLREVLGAVALLAASVAPLALAVGALGLGLSGIAAIAEPLGALLGVTGEAAAAAGIAFTNVAAVVAGPAVAALVAFKAGLDDLKAHWAGVLQEILTNSIQSAVNSGATVKDLEAVGYSVDQIKTAFGTTGAAGATTFQQIQQSTAAPIEALTSMGFTVQQIATALKGVQVDGLPAFEAIKNGATIPELETLGANLDLIAKKLNALVPASQQGFAQVTSDLKLVITGTDLWTQSEQTYADAQSKANDQLVAAQKAVSDLKADLAAGYDVQNEYNRAVLALQQAQIAANPTLKEAKVNIEAVSVALHEMFDDAPAGIANLDAYWTEWDKVNDKLEKAQTDFTILKSIFDQTDSDFANGVGTIGNLVEAYNKASTAAKQAGQDFQSVDGMIAKLIQTAAQQNDTLTTSVLAFARLQAGMQGIQGGAAIVSDALKGMTTAASALGITITPVGDGFTVAAKDSTAGSQAMVKALTDIMTQAGLTVSTVTGGIQQMVNGPNGVTIIAPAAEKAAQGIQLISTASLNGQVNVLHFGTAVATATGALATHAAAAGTAKAAEDSLGTTVINISKDFGPMVEQVGAVATAHVAAAAGAHAQAAGITDLSLAVTNGVTAIQGFNGNIATAITGTSNFVVSAGDMQQAVAAMNITIAANGSKMIDFSHYSDTAADSLQTFRQAQQDATTAQTLANTALGLGDSAISTFGDVVGTAHGHVGDFTDSITTATSKTDTFDNGLTVTINNLDSVNDAFQSLNGTMPTTTSDLDAVAGGMNDIAADALIAAANVTRLNSALAQAAGFAGGGGGSSSSILNQLGLNAQGGEAGGGEFSAGGVSNGSTSSLGSYFQDVAAFEGTALSDVFGSTLTQMANAAGYQQTGNNQFESDSTYNAAVQAQVANLNASFGTMGKYVYQVGSYLDAFGNTIDTVQQVLNSSYTPATTAAATATSTLGTAATGAITGVTNLGTSAGSTVAAITQYLDGMNLVTSTNQESATVAQQFTDSLNNGTDAISVSVDSLGNWTSTLQSTGQTIQTVGPPTEQALENLGLSADSAKNLINLWNISQQGATTATGTATTAVNQLATAANTAASALSTLPSELNSGGSTTPSALTQIANALTAAQQQAQTPPSGYTSTGPGSPFAAAAAALTAAQQVAQGPPSGGIVGTSGNFFNSGTPVVNLPGNPLGTTLQQLLSGIPGAPNLSQIQPTTVTNSGNQTVNFTLNVNAGTVVGNNGTQQLAAMLAPTIQTAITQALRQIAGLKLS